MRFSSLLKFAMDAHSNSIAALDRRIALPAGFVLGCTLGFGEAIANEEFAGFDAQVLRQRGIDPRLAEYFSVAARFTPGDHKVKLKVNGRGRGSVLARFDDEGKLCFNFSLLQSAGLRASGDAAACAAFIEQFPLTEVHVHPDINEIELVVPVDALSEVPRDLSGFSSGGVAGIINYELFGISSRYEQGSSRSTSAKTEVGFNAGDWIVRSHQLYNNSNGTSELRHLDAYAQRTFASIGSVLQVGQIQLNNPVLGGAQVTGVQLSNEQGLAGQGGRAQVEGIAQGAARVEVRQAGNLIYTTVVPGGPFVLRDIARVNQRAAMEVTVIEADGSRQQFSVSAAEAGIATPDNGYVLGIGHTRNIGDTPQSTVMTGGWTTSVGRDTSLSVGAMASTDYYSAGAGVGRTLWPGASARADVVSSQSAAEGVEGVQSRVSLTQRLGDRWSFNGALTQQSSGYREMLEGSSHQQQHHADYTQSRARSQWNAGMGWSHDTVGGVSAGYSQSTLFNGTRTSRANATWSKAFKGATLSVTAERDLGRQGVSGEDHYRAAGTALYASVSVPLGGRKRVRATYTDNNDRQRITTTLSDSPSDMLSYRIGAQRNLTTGDNGLSAGVSLLPRYAQLELGYSGDGAQAHSVNAGLRGGLVLHENGLTPSAYAVGDTFALVQVGDVAGVKVDTPSGPVWTDGSGRAVVPTLNAFRRSSLEVAPKSLPRNMDLSDGVRQVNAGRGAVERIDFGVTITRRVLLDVKTESGARLPAGASVLDAQQSPLGLVDQEGAVFIANAVNLGRLWVSSPEMPSCELQFELPQEPDAQAYYEIVPAVCRAA